MIEYRPKLSAWSLEQLQHQAGNSTQLTPTASRLETIFLYFAKEFRRVANVCSLVVAEDDLVLGFDAVVV